MKVVRIITLTAAIAAASASTAAAASAAAPLHAAAARHFEGTVVSVSTADKSFRLRDSERGTVVIAVTAATRFERIAGFAGLKAGLKRVEAKVKRSGDNWVALKVERSGRDDNRGDDNRGRGRGGDDNGADDNRGRGRGGDDNKPAKADDKKAAKTDDKRGRGRGSDDKSSSVADDKGGLRVGSDDPAGDDKGGLRVGSDDPAGDDHGGHGGDDTAADDKGGHGSDD